MSKVSLNIRTLPIPQKIAKARTIITALTGNPNFTTPSPTLEVLSRATDNLETSAATVQSTRAKLKTDVSEQTKNEDSFDGIFSQLAGYIQSVAGDDEAIIHSAGLDTKAPKSPSSAEPTVPQALTPTVGDHDGEVDLSWDTVPKAKSYVIQISADPPTEKSWQHAGVSPKSSFTVTGLIPGTRYWFRVAAVGSGGQSGWSDPAMKIAP